MTDFNDAVNADRNVAARMPQAITEAPRKLKPFNQRRDYGMVHSNLWLGRRVPAFRKLSPQAKMLELYLLSSPHSNMLGLYLLPLGYMVADTGLGDEAVSAALIELEDARLVSYDQDTGYVFVRYFIETQVLSEVDALHPKDKRAIHAQRVFESLQGSPFHEEFFEAHGAALNLRNHG